MKSVLPKSMHASCFYLSQFLMKHAFIVIKTVSNRAQDTAQK